jgi:Cupredoxin-like domain
VFPAAVLVAGSVWAGNAAGTYHLDLTMTPPAVKAGEPVALSFQAIDPRGKSIRFLELVHERPLHLLIVSEDLADFDHVHPEQVVGTTYDVTHVFPHGGRFRMYASYTPPGSGTLVQSFTVNVAGTPAPAVPLVSDERWTKVVDGVKAALRFDGPLHAGADIALECSFTDAVTGNPVTDLQLYLGSLAHIVLIHQDLGSFVHLHPFEAGEVYDPSKDPSAHFHDPKDLAKKLIGASPSQVTASANFPRAGTYKLWVQIARGGRTITVPFVLDVAAGSEAGHRRRPPVARDAIKVTVSASGYSPSRIDVERGRTVKLAFSRPEGGNCGGTVRFPALNREYTLPVGGTVVVELTPTESGELAFTCGMGMLKGVLVVK